MKRIRELDPPEVILARMQRRARAIAIVLTVLVAGYVGGLVGWICARTL